MHFKFSKTKTLNKIGKGLAVLSVLFLLVVPVFGANENQLRNSVNNLQKQIKSGEQHLDHLQDTTQTLEQKLNSLKNEIAKLEGEINTTNKKVAKTEKELKATEAELARQKEIMASSLRTLYKMGRVGIVESIVDSENFGDFVNQEEYVERVKIQVHESSKEVAALKEQLEKEKDQLEELLATQTGQKILMDAKKREQQELVNKARSAEFSYKNHVESLRKKEAAARKELIAFLQRGRFVSQGRINRGDIVGYTGGTGSGGSAEYGTHLHLGLWDPAAGGFVDPVASYSEQTLKYGFSWPYSTYYPVTSEFGCRSFPSVTQPAWCPSDKPHYHEGVDIGGPSGAPVRAIGSGNIIHRGLYYGAGYTVMVQHDNGYISHYYHMQPF